MVSIKKFVTLLAKSRLLAEPEAQQIATVFQQECQRIRTPASLDAFCSFLIATDRLTQWQIDKLRIGKWKGFYLDNFVILDVLGPDLQFGPYYRARNISDGEIVRLEVMPYNSKPGPGIKYRVEPLCEE
jgi:hypothetical protein